MRILLIASYFIAGLCFAKQSDDPWYIGFDAGYAAVHYKVDYSKNTATSSKNYDAEQYFHGRAVGFHVGRYFTTKHRFKFSVRHLTSAGTVSPEDVDELDVKIDTYAAGFDYDYIIPMSETVSWILGLHTHIHFNQFVNFDNLSEPNGFRPFNERETTFQIGGQTGFDFNIDKHWLISLMYHITTNNKSLTEENDNGSTKEVYHLRQDHLMNVLLQLSYRF